MSVFRYPQNDLDNSNLLLNLLGSFWATTYQGNDLVENLTQVTGQIAKQTYTQLLELVNSVSRFDVPVFHRENWYALTILESQINNSNELIPKYGSGLTYEISTSNAYGMPSPGVSYAVTKPANLVATSVILNRLTTPSVEYLDGIDFQLTESLILFRENPFQNKLIPKVEKLNALGEIVDRECTLWIYQGDWEWNSIYESFGYALNLKMQSSEGYKSFINAILDALTEGTSKRTQQLALAAAFGIPLVIEAEETVETIVRTDVLNIITNVHVYQFPLTATESVTVGATVYAGDTLTDAFQIIELNRGAVIPEATLSALAVGQGVLGNSYWSDITFENKAKPLIVQLNVDGYTRVSWELGGFPFDIEKFWDDVHSNGIAKNQTLAMLLDKRTNPDTQPLSSSLPVTINPLQFLADNFLRNNAFIVKVKSGISFPDRLSYIPIEQVRKILPPHTLMLLVIELVYQDLPVIMESSGTLQAPGYEENISGFPCMAITETIGTSSLSERIRTTKIGGRCI